eukprot:scaffold1650_cov351-Prasinococcus_capsulatus_cf.AAC.1
MASCLWRGTLAKRSTLMEILPRVSPPAERRMGGGERGGPLGEQRPPPRNAATHLRFSPRREPPAATKRPPAAPVCAQR